MRPLEHCNGLVIESYAEIDIVSKAIGEACLVEVYQQLADDLNASLGIAASSIDLKALGDNKSLIISDKPLMILIEGLDAALVTEALVQFAKPDGDTLEQWLAQDMLDSLQSRDWHS